MNHRSPESPEGGDRIYDVRDLLVKKQAELDTSLAELSDEIDMWNLRFRDLQSVGDYHREDTVGNLKAEAINSLDKKWPFMGDYVHVSGAWQFPSNIELSNDNIHFELSRQEAFSTVRSNGFNIFTEPGQPARIGLSFLVGGTSFTTAAAQGDVGFLAFAEPSEVSLIYARPADTANVKTDLEKLCDELLMSEMLLYMHFHDPNSIFFKLPAKRQERYLSSAVAAVSSVMPSPEFGPAAICKEVMATHVYQHIEDSDMVHSWHKILTDDGEPMLLAGYVRGVGVLEASRVGAGIALRSQAELVDSESSLCLVVDVQDSTTTNIVDGRPVYVPLRHADQMQLIPSS